MTTSTRNWNNSKIRHNNGTEKHKCTNRLQKRKLLLVKNVKMYRGACVDAEYFMVGNTAKNKNKTVKSDIDKNQNKRE